MDNILVVGAGGVSHVTVHKMAQNPNYFKNIILASRSIEKCFQIKKSVKVDAKGSKFHTLKLVIQLQWNPNRMPQPLVYKQLYHWLYLIL